MVSAIFTSLAQSSMHRLSSSSKLSSSLRTPVGIPKLVAPGRLIRISNRGLRPVCFFNSGEEKSKTKLEPQESGLDWPALKRWDVPWEWPTVSLTSLACGIRF
ncbi:unnamed protein product [Linum tenue]|uniref:Uncharacterized protein n=1 Tax=Linum tenue TaxID=586396 RepID=A0AAV0MNX2_9ROSI|nr:unnamed protein product [Linum tenue]